jgi:hypothetical protein
MPRVTIAERLSRIDWKSVESTLAEQGYARLPRLLNAAECAALITLYDGAGWG